MELKQIEQIFADTAYIRTGGSPEERQCAEYIRDLCVRRGLEAQIEEFPADMSTMKRASFYADGVEIPCTGYLCAGSGEVEAPFHYLTNTDPWSLSQVRGKIVMVDGRVGYWLYHDLQENGALGYVTYDGNTNWPDREIDVREQRSYVHCGKRMPAVHINVKDAVALIQKGVSTAKLILDQEEYQGTSQNVIADLPGEIPETIVLTAHYDSTATSQGAYDNMSGSIGILAVAEYFSAHPHRYGLRFLWCGSEERGLLGSKAYAAAHEEELKNVVLNVNLDMIGCTMGKFIACCTAEDKLVSYIEYLAAELGFGVAARQGVYSSDSTPLSDKGVPSVSFARIAPGNTAQIHCAHDTAAIMSARQMAADAGFITAFTSRMANAQRCPVARTIPDNMKEDLDVYLLRKRKK